jgi:hypothetical protein
MNTLYLEKISQFDHTAAPVTVSIPLAKGKLADPSRLVIRDGDVTLPVQRRALATWEDSSVKWLLIHFQPDLLGNQDKTLHFEIVETATDVPPDVSVAITETPSGVEVNTGTLSFLVPNDGFLPISNVTLDGKTLWGERPLKGFTLRYDGQEVSTASGPIELEVEEAGPMRAVILVRGVHRRADGSGYLGLRGRITAYANKPYLEVEHQFIHAEEEAELSLEGLHLEFRPEPDGTPHLTLGGAGSWGNTVIQQADIPLEMALTTETMLYQQNEHFIDSFYGDFWADWRDESAGLTLSIYQAHQNFPKKLRVQADGITCSLYPNDVPPSPLLQGMAKTHRIQLHFCPADTPIQGCSVLSMRFQLPERPTLSRSWLRDNNPWVAPLFPDNVPDRLLTLLNQLHDGRPKALGMFHFGDAPDAGYTHGGRGQGQVVWVNSEYDRPHACALYYGLTGQRHVLDSGLVSARHWLDVDLCHYSPDPLVHGGLKIHTKYHVTGGVTASHEWTEGLLDYYFLTGRREGLEAARSVAENIVRHMARPKMRTAGGTSARECGWALRAMVGMWLGTGEERWKTEAKRLIDLFVDWYGEYDAILAPYAGAPRETSYFMPREIFMISVAISSVARYLLIEEDERVEKLIVETVDDMIENGLAPDGITYYKEVPSLRRTAPTPHFLEAVTWAYRITGDERYLKVGARQFAALTSQSYAAMPRAKYADESGALISGEGRACNFADKYVALLFYAGVAAPLGFLDWYEYPF